MAKPAARQDWPILGQAPDSITAPAHQLAEDARTLQKAIQGRQKGASVPSGRLVPLCKSLEAFIEKFLNRYSTMV